MEYSANLEKSVDFPALCKVVHETILSTGLFELGALRVRALRADAYAVADLLPENARAALLHGAFGLLRMSFFVLRRLCRLRGRGRRPCAGGGCDIGGHQGGRKNEDGCERKRSGHDALCERQLRDHTMSQGIVLRHRENVILIGTALAMPESV
jgi:5-carboxymethyl-2-hydroxymuconate isomerase